MVLLTMTMKRRPSVDCRDHRWRRQGARKRLRRLQRRGGGKCLPLVIQTSLLKPAVLRAKSCILAATEGDIYIAQFEILANGTALRRNSSANQDLCQLHGVEFKVDSEIQTGGHSTPAQRFLLALVNCDVLPQVQCPPSSVLLQF